MVSFKLGQIYGEQARLPQALIEKISRRAEGNPFYVCAGGLWQVGAGRVLGGRVGEGCTVIRMALDEDAVDPRGFWASVVEGLRGGGVDVSGVAVGSADHHDLALPRSAPRDSSGAGGVGVGLWGVLAVAVGGPGAGPGHPALWGQAGGWSC